MKTLEELFSELQPLTTDRNHKEALPVIERSQLLYCSLAYHSFFLPLLSFPVCRFSLYLLVLYPSHGVLRACIASPSHRSVAYDHWCGFVAVLAQAPEDQDALRCKVVALIHLKKFDEAIAVFNKAPSIASVCAWEKAYVQYRLNRHQDAIQVIEAAAPKVGVDVRMDLLRAQVLYRLGQYHDCGELYGSLVDDETDPGELIVNRSAAMTAADEAEDAELVLKGAAAMLGETADMAYNRCPQGRKLLVCKAVNY
jgi:tetratricopeptide (TPR) repeat protein